MKNYKEMSYEMPDGTVIMVKAQRFRVPEILFNPEHFGLDIDGIAKKCYDSINKSYYEPNSNIHRDLYSSIILSGGTTMKSRPWPQNQ